jgi:DNA (cytosine-5)-methyltransferase 1
VPGAARLPVIAIYTIYQFLVELIPRYKGNELLSLRSHTTSDFRAKGIGDIEVIEETGEFFEGVEVKHNKSITAAFIEDAFEKFKETRVQRYYLLTTADPYLKPDENDKIEDIIRSIRIKHGCEVIVNGIIPSLKYYLRLINDPAVFLQRYTQNLEAEFSVAASIKEEHIRKWKAIRESFATY